VFAFSYGPRSCIGRTLAWVEMMTILANLLKDYNISLPKDSIYSPSNVNKKGIPLVMPSKCHIVFAPTNPERDCRLVLSKRTE
jgi:cytochrome P450